LSYVSQAYSEWDRDSITSESTVTTVEYDTRRRIPAPRMDFDSDLASLSSYDALSPPPQAVKRSPPRAKTDDGHVKVSE
jgi:hypothetical protein